MSASNAVSGGKNYIHKSNSFASLQLNPKKKYVIMTALACLGLNLTGLLHGLELTFQWQSLLYGGQERQYTVPHSKVATASGD